MPISALKLKLLAFKHLFWGTLKASFGILNAKISNKNATFWNFINLKYC